MAGENIIRKYSTMEIAQMFSDYVTRMEDRPRHTKAADKEIDAFDTYCASEFPRNMRVQNELYGRMMNAAVEFEESGFIAGFKTAMALVSGDEGFLPGVSDEKAGEKPEKAKELVLTEKANKYTNKKKTTEHEAVKEPQCALGTECDKYIDTTQIAKMFERTNWKTCRTINNSIIPFLTEDEKKDFILDTKRSRFKKEQTVYKLTLNGCKKFIEVCSGAQFKMYSNFAEGIELLKQEMEKTWCGGCECYVM